MMRALLLILFLLISMPVQAKPMDIHCAALDEHDTYPKAKRSYRYLVIGGENKDWVFRSKADFKEDFSLKPQTIELFKRLNETLKKKGKTLHIMMAPTRGIVHHQHVPPPPQNILKAMITKRQRHHTSLLWVN